MQKIAYSFYKGNKNLDKTTFKPEKIQFNDKLTGYGYNLNSDANHIILMFGGSSYVAYNTIGEFGGYYDCPVVSVDYYGTQNSKGKINLKTQQKSAEDLYDWVIRKYPDKKITIIGHSYGCGMAAYLASIKKCENLILLSGYRDLADMYNKFIPIFWGPMKVFISNNIDINTYAKSTKCNVTIIGSKSDTTLSDSLQEKLANCYENANLKIYDNIVHLDYLKDLRVIVDIKAIINE
ncbi:MAG: alpha/beta fold hydrolase [Clostridia bacterium]|nr:alpha/beta fold hydrolase [Clostridia bacterium]